MIRRVALIAVILAAVFAAPASASFSPGYEAEYEAAVAWWGQPPPLCQKITKEEVDLPEAGGEATEPTGREDCVIKVRPGMSGCPLTVLMRHEVGHLEGHGHSPDPGNIMNPTALLYNECDRAVLLEKIAGDRAWIAAKRRHCNNRRGRVARRECFWALREGRRALREKEAKLAALG